MAVTTTYSFGFVQNLDLVGTSTAMDLTGLSGGGLAGLGDSGAQVDATFFNSAPAQAGTSPNVTGLNGSLDQLTNGNVVIATEAAGSISYRIVNSVGGPVRADTATDVANTDAPDVAALTGGQFVVAYQRDFVSDHDINLTRYSAAGDPLGNVLIDPGLDDDVAPAVTGLADGGFAVAWTRDLGGGVTEAWHAIYDHDGAERLAPSLIDDVGDVNLGMSIVDLAAGGYAIAYHSDGWGGPDLDITLARFDAVGGFLGWTRVTTDGGNDTEVALARLSNGLIAVTFSNDVFGDNDVLMQLVDPVSGDLLLANPVELAATLAEEFDSAAAGWGLAGVAVSIEGASDNVAAHQLVRTSSSNAASDVITGDDAVDVMHGAGGDDTMDGEANRDTLLGGAGNDSLIGGDGGDSLDGQSNDDTLIGQLGNDTLLGGDGFDLIIGGDGSDSLAGSDGADVISCGAGTDNIAGGVGDDFVDGSFGSDTMAGGSGGDTLDFTVLSGDTFLDLGSSAKQNTRSGGADVIIGYEHVRTGSGDDRVLGSGQANNIRTSSGADTIKAADGADSITAGDGDDKVNGGGGADDIRGGGGRDLLRGGLLNDTFAYDTIAESGVGLALCDVIRDFRTSDGDQIDLVDVSPVELSFIGGSSFGGVGTAEVRVDLVEEGQLVQVDVDGDGGSDMDILVTSSGLTGGAADFWL